MPSPNAYLVELDQVNMVRGSSYSLLRILQMVVWVALIGPSLDGLMGLTGGQLFGLETSLAM